MAKIIALVGCTSSGKTEISKRLNAKDIISTTSRPPRIGETELDYHFVSFPIANQMMLNGEFIERRIYKTKFGLWLYGITKNEIDLKSDTIYKVVIDFQGLKDLIDYCNKNKQRHIITSIFIDASEETRKQRSKDRQKDEMTDEILEEIDRRIKDDNINIIPYKSECCMILKNEHPEDLENCITFINQYISAIQNK